MYFRLLVCLICCTLCGCGYRYGESCLSSSYRSFSVPFVDGDPDGDLTASIIREIAGSFPLCYREEGGDLIIDAKVIEFDDENIGYRYSYKKGWKRTDFIKPVESRMNLIVELALIDANTQKPIYDPVRLVATIDIDHNYNYSVWKKGVTQFSLGQLSDADAAFEAARRPLNRAMAEKIIIYLNGL